jgi:hypothetical protein
VNEFAAPLSLSSIEAHPILASNPTDTQPQPLRILFRDGHPCDETILAPKPSPLPLELVEKAEKEAKEKKREQKYERARNRIAETLARYGRTGEPSDKYLPPDGIWESSLKPDHLFTFACASGVYGQSRTDWEPRKIVNPIRADKARKAREAEGFDVLRFEEAQAARERWQFGPWKGCVSSSGQVLIADSTETAHWEPLVDQPAIVAPQASVDMHSQQAIAPATAPNKVTAELLNSIYQDYASNPSLHEGNLIAALAVHAKSRFAYKAHREIGNAGYQDQDDVIANFVIHLMQQIRDGKYEHSGQLDKWVGKLWVRFFAGFKKDLFIEANCTIRLNLLDEENEAGEVIAAGRGQVNPTTVDREVANRDTENWNDPSRRVSRMMRDLDNPATEFGQLDDDLKKMIRVMAKGKTKAEAAESVGLSERQARRKFEKVLSLREQTFISWPTEAERHRREVSL